MILLTPKTVGRGIDGAMTPEAFHLSLLNGPRTSPRHLDRFGGVTLVLQIALDDMDTPFMLSYLGFSWVTGRLLWNVSGIYRDPGR